MRWNLPEINFKTPLTTEEIKSKIAQVQQRNASTSYRVDIDDGHFLISYRRPAWMNAWNPEFHGTILEDADGSVVKGEFTRSRFVRVFGWLFLIFLSIWLVSATIVAVIYSRAIHGILDLIKIWSMPVVVLLLAFPLHKLFFLPGIVGTQPLNDMLDQIRNTTTRTK